MSSWPDERGRNGGIDEVPVPGPGRVWLCGKHFIGPDPEVALERTGAAVVVCLNERGELEDRYPEFVDEVLGVSPKKWAVVVVALLVGIVGTLWLVRRSRGRALEPVEEVVVDAAVA